MLNKAEDLSRPGDCLTIWTLLRLGPDPGLTGGYAIISWVKRHSRQGANIKAPDWSADWKPPCRRPLRGGKQAQDIYTSSLPDIQPALLGEGNLRKHVHSGGKKRNKRAGREQEVKT